MWSNEQKKHSFIACDDEDVDDVFVYETDFRFPRYRIAKDLRLLFNIKAYHDYRDAPGARPSTLRWTSRS